MMTASFLCLLFSPEAAILKLSSDPSAVSSRSSELTPQLSSPHGFLATVKSFLLKDSLFIQRTNSTHKSMGLFLNLFALNKDGDMITELYVFPVLEQSILPQVGVYGLTTTAF